MFDHARLASECIATAERNDSEGRPLLARLARREAAYWTARAEGHSCEGADAVASGVYARSATMHFEVIS